MFAECCCSVSPHALSRPRGLTDGDTLIRFPKHDVLAVGDYYRSVGYGPIVDRNAVIAQRDLVLAMRDRMLPLIAKGMTVDQVLAAKLTADSEASIPQGAQTAEQFVRWLHTELTESQQNGAGSAPEYWMSTCRGACTFAPAGCWPNQG